MALPAHLFESGANDLELLLRADEQGFKLEITGSLTTWELHPLPRHQLAVGQDSSQHSKIGRRR